MKTTAIMIALAMITALAAESLAAECQADTPEPVIMARFLERCAGAAKGTEGTKETEGTKATEGTKETEVTKRTKGTEGMKGGEGAGRKGAAVNGDFLVAPLLKPWGALSSLKSLSSLVSLEGGANG